MRALRGGAVLFALHPQDAPHGGAVRRLPQPRRGGQRGEGAEGDRLRQDTVRGDYHGGQRDRHQDAGEAAIGGVRQASDDLGELRVHRPRVRRLQRRGGRQVVVQLPGLQGAGTGTHQTQHDDWQYYQGFWSSLKFLVVVVRLIAIFRSAWEMMILESSWSFIDRTSLYLAPPLSHGSFQIISIFARRCGSFTSMRSIRVLHSFETLGVAGKTTGLVQMFSNISKIVAPRNGAFPNTM
mmetsp:Transcript_26038/g.65087  ORF Transcript_26038/g.65087 Transcript_26038/m.65087 type:complete len:238 (-) Transcript_26038:897-1610(-)